MADTHQIVTKVWIAPGCIVCDSCENDCPEVFDVQEQTCVIRPSAQKSDYLAPLTPAIEIAAEGCPVDVIKFETKEVPGEAPWADQPVTAPAGAGAAGETRAAAPVGRQPAALAPMDPKWQALLGTSRISPSQSGSGVSTIARTPEINLSDGVIHALNGMGSKWKTLPPDQRMALLAVGGAYRPAPSMSERIRAAAGLLSAAARSTRREVNVALLVGWGSLALLGGAFGAMFQDFFAPKVLKEPKKVYRVGRVSDFANPGVYEQYKPNNIWLVNLQPTENRLVALNTVCTHLGCIPNWLAADQKFKCPCHGSGYYVTGVNFEGPTPRPLERFAISRDADGYIWVDQRTVFRQELGEWDNPDSYLEMV